MKQQQALTAYTTIIGLGKRATGKSAFALFKLKSRLKELVDFQSEEEMKLIEKHGGKLEENGFVTFKNDEEKAKFVEERRELANMDIDPEIAPVRIDPEQIPDINIDEIEALNGFVEFE